jgi:hypothetical protein
VHCIPKASPAHTNGYADVAEFIHHIKELQRSASHRLIELEEDRQNAWCGSQHAMTRCRCQHAAKRLPPLPLAFKQSKANINQSLQ